MGYIVKDTQGLIISRLTDVGRRKISQGNFNISYFQIGDSEINYSGLQSNGQQSQTLAAESMVLEPAYNAHNNVGSPQSNKNEIKYPFYLKGTSGLTYGIPYEASTIDDVFNTASPLGFFNIVSDSQYNPIFSALTYNSRFYVTNSPTFGGTNILTLNQAVPCGSLYNTISAGTIVTLFMRCDAINDCTGFFDSSGYAVLTYKVLSISSPTEIVLDRSLPNFSSTYPSTCNGNVFFYFGSLRDGFDTSTPLNYWSQSVINYESLCTPDDGYVKIWNMNIPWSESPAGTNPNGPNTFAIIPEYNEFGSFEYIGTKEYYGYMSSDGQYFVNGYNYNTTSTTTTQIFNSNNIPIDIEPEDQKCIAIIHYTNNSIIDFYGEKFATELESEDNLGLGSNFKIHLPWIMWHKNTETSINGLTLYIDPPTQAPGGNEWMVPFYLKSKKNQDMNNPGIRYFRLLDNNPNSQIGNRLNCVGKVFPDDKIIIIDDEELVAAMSYLSNRNYTLPAPNVKTVTPTSGTGLLASDNDTLWVTYRFRSPYWQGMHCNYYTKVKGPAQNCNLDSQNVQVDFVNSTYNQFPYMKDYNNANQRKGWGATGFDLIVQKVTTGQRPNPKAWKVISYDDFLVQQGVKPNTNSFIKPTAFQLINFNITNQLYNSAPFYNIQSQIQITPKNSNGLKFGDEYYFYGNVETDIQATIYQMKYLINLPSNQFTDTSNPSYQGSNRYMTEIGLYDNDKNLLVLSKFNSPQIRQDVQRITIKLDF